MNFTWIPFFKEFADKLLRFRNDRASLINWIYDNLEGHINHFKDDNNGTRVADVDPFTVFAIINRGITFSKKQEICTKFKNFLKITAPVPQDFNGVPEMNNQRTNFMAFAHDRKNGDIERLWAVFEDAVKDREIKASYNALSNQFLINRNLTFGLFWIRPDKYLALDGNNAEALKSMLNIRVKSGFVPYNDYIDIMKQLDAKMQSGEIKCSSYAEFSVLSYKQNGGASTRDTADGKVVEMKQQDKEFSSGDLGITRAEWYKLLLDKDASQYIDALLCFLREPNHTSSCTEVAEKNGEKPQHYNSKITNFAKWVQKKLGRFKIKDANGENSYWGIPMQKGWKTKQGFQWQMRDELVKALQDYLMHNLIQSYKTREAFNGFREEYKWALLDSAEGEDVEGVIKCLKGKNVVYNAQVDAIFKTLWETKPEELSDCINNLWDENKPLQTRIEEYWDDMRSICPGDWKVWANDERTASALLTCKYPSQYTFYKHEIYTAVCKYFGFEQRDAYQKFAHFIEIVNDFAANFGKEIQLLMLPQIAKYRNKPLNLAVQTLFWTMREEIKAAKRPDSIIQQSSTAMPKTKYQEYIDLLEEARNLVLTGAPGTGKTFLAKEIVKAMGAETDFVQFHPSYDYTDFVEGLRPLQKDGGEMGFERKDGIFKEFCKKALKNWEDSQKTPNEIIEEESLEEKYNELLQRIEDGELNKFQLRTGDKVMEVVEISDYNNIILKTPGSESSKTYTVSLNRLTKLAKVYTSLDDLDEISNIAKDIRDVIGGCNASAYWAVLREIYKQRESLRDERSIARPKYIGRAADIDSPDLAGNFVKEKKYVFIIDEVNRGEISKIFGELFFSIDPGYRGVKGRVKTQYQNLISEDDVFYDGFFVPENVYILATMNDIDRSVESMDFAMRRRFTWEEITPDDTAEMLDTLDCAEEAKATMNRLNAVIAKTEGLGAAYMVGPSYFLKLDENGGDFNKLWKMNIEPLLKEYLRGFRKAGDILGKLKKAYFGNNEESGSSSDLLDED